MGCWGCKAFRKPVGCVYVYSLGFRVYPQISKNTEMDRCTTVDGGNLALPNKIPYTQKISSVGVPKWCRMSCIHCSTTNSIEGPLKDTPGLTYYPKMNLKSSSLRAFQGR